MGHYADQIDAEDEREFLRKREYFQENREKVREAFRVLRTVGGLSDEETKWLEGLYLYKHRMYL